MQIKSPTIGRQEYSNVQAPMCKLLEVDRTSNQYYRPIAVSVERLHCLVLELQIVLRFRQLWEDPSATDPLLVTVVEPRTREYMTRVSVPALGIPFWCRHSQYSLGQRKLLQRRNTKWHQTTHELIEHIAFNLSQPQDQVRWYHALCNLYFQLERNRSVSEFNSVWVWVLIGLDGHEGLAM